MSVVVDDAGSSLLGEFEELSSPKIWRQFATTFGRSSSPWSGVTMMRSWIR